MDMRWVSPGLLWAFLLAGCSNPLVTDVEDRVTITRGVYGQLIGGCDTDDCSSRYLSDARAGAFTSDPATDSTLEPVATGDADELGFYEIELDAGTYFLLVDWDPGPGFARGTTSQMITVSDGVERRDWTSGPGGGRWQ